ncbi:hypothetical protein V6N13_144694 [Hibiscus sabdariffa]
MTRNGNPQQTIPACEKASPSEIGSFVFRTCWPGSGRVPFATSSCLAHGQNVGQRSLLAGKFMDILYDIKYGLRLCQFKGIL